ncbi:MAG: hypothetical protein ACOY0T_24960 [Myxococcota bacterium]
MTSYATQSDEFDALLNDFEALQARETAVLRAMKSSEIDGITLEKEQLTERLRDLGTRVRPAAHHRARLQRLRERAVLNQLLLIHARDAVRTILSQVSGTPFDGLPNARKPIGAEGLRLNVRV